MEPQHIDKQKRYDRQLRIWGQQGQQLLENSSICLLNASPAGTETLKNLILGGIGSFLIVDPNRVTKEDLGNNFYVTKSSLGKSRASEVVELLQELNENVPGRYLEASVEELLQNQQQTLLDCDVIILTQVSEDIATQIDQLCRKAGKKVLNINQFGLFGSVQISSQEQFQSNQHQENQVPDLRLTSPWKELQQYVDSIKMEELDDIQHKHVPYAVILIKVAEAYKQKHGGKLPKTMQEKKNLKAIISDLHRRGQTEDNLKEALDQAKLIFNPLQIPREVYDLFEDPQTSYLTHQSPHFRFLIAALKKFVDQFGTLPLEGSLPDMTSTTEMYVALQQVYKSKADQEVKLLAEYVSKSLQSVGLPSNTIQYNDIKTFAKNSSQIAKVSYSDLPGPMYLQQNNHSSSSNNNGNRSLQISGILEDEFGAANVTIYVIFRTLDVFRRHYNRYPGTIKNEIDKDKIQLRQYVHQVAQKLMIPQNTLLDEYVDEACRSGPIQLHTVGAILGGIAAQEIIKLVTLQFKPLDGVLVYNGIAQTTSVLNV